MTDEDYATRNYRWIHHATGKNLTYKETLIAMANYYGTFSGRWHDNKFWAQVAKGREGRLSPCRLDAARAREFLDRLRGRILMSKRLPALVLLMFVLSACTQAPAQKVVSPRANTPQYQLFNGQYEIVQVEGMNCLVWDTGNRYGMGGITCDWTMYKGGD